MGRSGVETVVSVDNGAVYAASNGEVNKLIGVISILVLTSASFDAHTHAWVLDGLSSIVV
jgi:hypothetical protein